MGACRVAYTDSDGIQHAVDVDASSLYEAVALAVAEFRRDEIVGQELPIATEFVVTTYRKPVEHRIKLNQVKKWADPTTRDGPAGMMKRERELLNNSAS
jgi:hypothetical protein